MRTFSVISVLIACIICVVCASKTVEVVALTESLCPNCIDFINSDFKEVVNADEVFDRLNVKFLSWGNAYTETTSEELCPSRTPGKYDVNVRKCWNERCNRKAKPELFAECFNKSFETKITCQHGENEGIGNRIETCAVQMTLNKTIDSMSRVGAEFILCFSGEHKGQKDYAAECAKKAGIDYDQLNDCVNSFKGWNFLREEAVATNDYGVHPGVPYILVNGSEPPEGKSLLKVVCGLLDQQDLLAGCKKHIAIDEHKRNLSA